jgi:large subunit ribosomal protein L25
LRCGVFFDRLLTGNLINIMLKIKAEPRKELGRKINKQRKTGQIPAVVYGHGIKSEPLYVSAKEFGKAYKEAGESTLIFLEIEGKKTNVLIHDVQRHPLSDEIIHIDFYQVRMDEKIKAKVSLLFVGESPAVKAEGGVLIKNIQEVEIEALPQDLIHHIEVDISKLITYEDRVLIKDLPISGSVKILSDAEETVASVMPPRSEEELAALEEKVEEKIEEVKVAGEDKGMAAGEEVPGAPEAK